MKRISILMLMLFLLAGSIPCAHATVVTTYLDKDHQPGGEGNKGVLFRPVDEFGAPAIFELTAHSSVDLTAPLDPDASFKIGTVYIGKDGAGVQDIAGNGSKEISGGGPHQNEDLIFTFDNPISIDYIILGLVKVDLEVGRMGFKDDDPILFLSSAANPGVFDYTVLEQEVAVNFTMTGRHEGLLNFSTLNSTIPDHLVIDMFKIRETDGHIMVNLITVPEPATVALLGFGSLSLILRRRRVCAHKKE